MASTQSGQTHAKTGTEYTASMLKKRRNIDVFANLTAENPDKTKGEEGNQASGEPEKPVIKDKNKSREKLQKYEDAERTMTMVMKDKTEKETTRDKLQKYRSVVAGKVTVPDTWCQENLLKDWTCPDAFHRSSASAIVSARSALIQECRSTLSLTPPPLNSPTSI